MFNNNVEPLENLIDQFAQFPGIGRKSAVRMAYQVMSMPPKQAMELAKAIEHAKSDLHRCRICQDYTTGDVCKICASQKPVPCAARPDFADGWHRCRSALHQGAAGPSE